MKKNKFKGNKHKCYYCNTSNFITAYLVKDKCPICNRILTRRIKRRMRRILIKQFIRRCKYYEYRRKKNEQIANNQPTWRIEKVIK